MEAQKNLTLAEIKKMALVEDQRPPDYFHIESIIEFKRKITNMVSFFLGLTVALMTALIVFVKLEPLKELFV